ncbi:uncharacterized protein LOC110807326 isoform X1 [Carica papaya]|uniref:uncharacterized protein LOC110807326 isoform X1 n=1 Tax=Carica papaya TaxID=3649 RepID=UPI000B8CEDE4|nr:uncharacterized protein LOC110807326 isoform X1 [Carica papaya]
MLRLNRILTQARSSSSSIFICQHQLLSHGDNTNLFSLPSQHFALKSSNRFLDIYQIGNKAALEKERERFADEMKRGYFADLAELRKHGGKIAFANKTIIPAMAGLRFPDLIVDYSDGRTLKFPVSSNRNAVEVENVGVPRASLLCLSFRASSQVRNPLAFSWCNYIV